MTFKTVLLSLSCAFYEGEKLPIQNPLTKSVVRFFSGPNNLVFSFGTREKYLVTSGVLPQINMRFVSFLARNTTIVITDVVCQAVCVPEMSRLSISYKTGTERMTRMRL